MATVATRVQEIIETRSFAKSTLESLKIALSTASGEKIASIKDELIKSIDGAVKKIDDTPAYFEEE